MIDSLASAVVVLAGLYLVGLAVAAFAAPARMIRFLSGFAGSASAHYLELCIRLVVGGAFILTADRLLFPDVFSLFGWVLVVTTAGLFAIPWTWHRRIAQRSVPHAIRHLKLFGLASLVFGGFVLGAFLRAFLQ